MSRVFLHIGAPKTGTTYLQDTIAENRSLLLAEGLAYPDGVAGTHFEAAIDLLDHRWGGRLDGARGQWDALSGAASAVPGTVLISHEILAAATEEQVARAMHSLRGNEVHLIYTTRDLARQIPAEWQEQIKHRRVWKYAAFCRDLRESPREDSEMWFWRVQHVPDVLRRWGADLPPERIHVVTVPPRSAGPTVLWDRFAGVLGIPEGLPLKSSTRSNTSIGIPDIGMLRKLNQRLLKKGIPQQVYAATVRELVVHQTLAQRKKKQPVHVPPRLRPFAEEVTQEWVDYLTTSGVDVVGDVEELRPHWPTGKWVNPDEPDTEEMLDAALRALVAVVLEEKDRFNDERFGANPIRGIKSRLRRRMAWR